MTHRRPLLRALPATLGLLAALSAALLAAGCGTTPASRFYVLPAPPAAATSPAPAGFPAIKLLPVRLPDYLTRPAMAIRRGESEIHYLDTTRWAEALDDGVTRALGQALVAQLGDARVYRSGLGNGSAPADASALRVEVLRFDNAPDGTATLEARWQLGTRPWQHGRFSVPAGNGDRDGAVAALAATLAQLAAAIVAPPLRP